MTKKIFLVLFIFIFTFSCSSEDDIQGDLLSDSTEILESVIDTNITLSFDRSAMLVFWADNFIVPAYKKLKDDISVLKESIASFNEEPLQANFEIVREKWLSAYKTWQHVEMFNIGKAEEIYLSSFMNIYPVNEERITSNINSGIYDLENPNNYASQGFPALDYLLFGLGENDTKILEKYQPSDNNYSKYLVSVINKMEAKTNLVSNDWDSYRDAFVISTENTATSSINKLSNDFIFYFEKGLRANKFGIPAGVFSTDELPNKVEGYYSKLYSKTLALESLYAVKNFFIGKAFENDALVGDSFQSYLTFLNAKKNDTSLSDLILSKLDIAISSVTELNDDFTSQINTDNNTMLLTYDRIQSVVILLKVDMLQVLNVNVDYADADGD